MNHFFRSKQNRIRCHRRHLRLASLRHEELEVRTLLTSISLWNESSNLSLSFANDGADIAGEENALASFFETSLPGQDWQTTIVSAFQAWAANANVNIGVVDEEGALPFGTAGPRIGDHRFGDIRIGARPLAGDVRALSIPSDTLVSGTWSGDVIFNSSANYQNTQELFSVALHEAGHVFGLPHSEDENSPMHTHGVSNAITPTLDDKIVLQKIHGVRAPDIYDEHASNDRLTVASELKPNRLAQSHAGSAPSIAVADLGHQDLDFYEIKIPSGYAGSITVDLQTSGISLLNPLLTIFDDERNEIAEIHMDSSQGVTLGHQIPPTPNLETFFVGISAADPQQFSIGSYVLSVSFDGLDQSTTRLRDFFADSSLTSIDLRDIESYFESGEQFFNDDDHEDDEFEVADLLEEFEDFEELRRFNLIASLGDSEDVDYYEIEGPEEGSQQIGAMTVSIRNLDPEGSIPDLLLFDDDEEMVDAEVLINDGNELMLQVTGLESVREPEFIARVSLDSDQQQTLNYQMSILFRADAIEPQTELVKTLQGAPTLSVSELEVTESTKLMHFSLHAEGTDPNNEATIRILDRHDQVRLELTAQTGNTTTGNSILLSPGIYTVEAIAARPSPVKIELTSIEASIPIGLTPVEPNGTDFSCPGLNNRFCYPGGIESEQPFLWDDFLQQVPNRPDLPQDELVEALLIDWWQWYWKSREGNSPPLSISDRYRAAAGRELKISKVDGVLANDVDLNGDAIHAVLVAPPQNGTFDIQLDGSFRYTPDRDFQGIDSFQYRTTDAQADSLPTSVLIDVTQPVSDGDFNGDGITNGVDIDLLNSGIVAKQDPRFDLDQNGQFDENDRRVMIEEILLTSFGDANLDGTFDSSDLVAVFQAGKFEVANPLELVGWALGDWNGDGRFDSADFVIAFQSGNYQD